jgi:hypothetical protein
MDSGLKHAGMTKREAFQKRTFGTRMQSDLCLELAGMKEQNQKVFSVFFRAFSMHLCDAALNPFKKSISFRSFRVLRFFS